MNVTAKVWKILKEINALDIANKRKFGKIIIIDKNGFLSYYDYTRIWFYDILAMLED